MFQFSVVAFVKLRQHLVICDQSSMVLSLFIYYPYIMKILHIRCSACDVYVVDACLGSGKMCILFQVFITISHLRSSSGLFL